MSLRKNINNYKILLILSKKILIITIIKITSKNIWLVTSFLDLVHEFVVILVKDIIFMFII